LTDCTKHCAKGPSHNAMQSKRFTDRGWKKITGCVWVQQEKSQTQSEDIVERRSQSLASPADGSPQQSEKVRY